MQALHSPISTARLRYVHYSTCALRLTNFQIVNKVGASLDLCMGGVSVFSIDQDDEDNTLTEAIWDLGALTPPADQVALSPFHLYTHAPYLLTIWFSSIRRR